MINTRPIPRHMALGLVPISKWFGKARLKKKAPKRQTVSPKAGASQSQFYSGLVCWAGRSHSTKAQPTRDTSFVVEV